MSMNFRFQLILLPAVIPFLMGCEDDQVLQETIQNASPVAHLATVEDCIHESRPVILDASASTDDRTEAGLLEYRLDWDSDGYYDTPWSTDPVFTHPYPAGIHAARVQVRDEGYLKSSALCSFAVLPDSLPVDTRITWLHISSFDDFNQPWLDPMHFMMEIELTNDSELWLREMTVTVNLYDYYRNTIISELPVELKKDDVTWDGMIPSDSVLELWAIKSTRYDTMFDNPCGDVIFIEVCIAGSGCWSPMCIRTPPFTFSCMSG
jgi:hypothetical protein